MDNRNGDGRTITLTSLSELARERPVELPEPAAAAPRGPAGPVLGEHQRLDIAALRHPTENSFLAVIIVVNVLLLGGVAIACMVEPGLLLTVALLAGGLYLLNLVAFQLLFWFLYGNSIRVSAQQYPEVERAVIKACEYMDLRQVPKIFIMHGQGLLELFLIKRFIKRGMLVFTAELIETLLESGDSRQLMMVVGRQLGHIKAGHYRGWVFKDVIGQLAIGFHSAWARRCHYTADRIGLLVAGDLEASRRALIALTVGKKLARAASIEAVHAQESELADHFFGGFTQLLHTYPFIIRRVTELGSFAGHVRARAPDADANRLVGFLPPDVSSFQIVVRGHAIFGAEGNITILQPA